jgi:hypothetical protein
MAQSAIKGSLAAEAEGINLSNVIAGLDPR